MKFRKQNQPDRSVCTLSMKMQELLVRQIQHEIYNHNLYRTFANFFAVKGLTLLEKYYIDRAEEEKHHHDWITNYLSTSDACIKYPSIPEISEVFEDLVDPFRLTVDKEIETTNLIYEMVELAMEENDWMTYQWLMADDDESGRLVKEQVNFCLAA